MNYTTTAYSFFFSIRLHYQNLDAVYIIESEMFTFLTDANKMFRFQVG